MDTASDLCRSLPPVFLAHTHRVHWRDLPVYAEGICIIIGKRFQDVNAAGVAATAALAHHWWGCAAVTQGQHSTGIQRPYHIGVLCPMLARTGWPSHPRQPEDLLDAQLAVQLSLDLLPRHVRVPVLVQEALRRRHQRPAVH